MPLFCRYVKKVILVCCAGLGFPVDLGPSSENLDGTNGGIIETISTQLSLHLDKTCSSYSPQKLAKLPNAISSLSSPSPSRLLAEPILDYDGSFIPADEVTCMKAATVALISYATACFQRSGFQPFNHFAKGVHIRLEQHSVEQLAGPQSLNSDIDHLNWIEPGDFHPSLKKCFISKTDNVKEQTAKSHTDCDAPLTDNTSSVAATAVAAEIDRCPHVQLPGGRTLVLPSIRDLFEQGNEEPQEGPTSTLSASFMQAVSKAKEKASKLAAERQHRYAMNIESKDALRRQEDQNRQKREEKEKTLQAQWIAQLKAKAKATAEHSRTHTSVKRESDGSPTQLTEHHAADNDICQKNEGKKHSTTHEEKTSCMKSSSDTNCSISPAHEDKTRDDTIVAVSQETSSVSPSSFSDVSSQVAHEKMTASQIAQNIQNKRENENKLTRGQKKRKNKRRRKDVYNANGDRICFRGCGMPPHKGSCRSGANLVPVYDENGHRVCRSDNVHSKHVKHKSDDAKVNINDEKCIKFSEEVEIFAPDRPRRKRRQPVNVDAQLALSSAEFNRKFALADEPSEEKKSVKSRSVSTTQTPKKRRRRAYNMTNRNRQSGKSIDNKRRLNFPQGDVSLEEALLAVIARATIHVPTNTGSAASAAAYKNIDAQQRHNISVIQPTLLGDSALGTRMLQYFVGKLESTLGVSLHKVSVEHWDRAKLHTHTFLSHPQITSVIEGGSAIAEGMATGVGISYRCRVHQVEYNERHKQVRVKYFRLGTTTDAAQSADLKRCQCKPSDPGVEAVDAILICDGENCDSEYQMSQLTPRLYQVPVSKWFCPKCRIKMNQSSKQSAQLSNEKGDAVLVSVPLGCLRKKAIDFKPSLPSWKLRAIEGLGTGLVNRIAMVFPVSFWQNVVEFRPFSILDPNVMDEVVTETSSSPASRWEHSIRRFHRVAALGCEDRAAAITFHCASRTVGVPILIAEMAGGAAEDVELDDDDTVLDTVMYYMQRMFQNCTTAETAVQNNLQSKKNSMCQGRIELNNNIGNKKLVVPKPLAFCVTRWGADPYAQGTFSYVPVGGNKHMYDAMARAVADRVFWAGEATNRLSPASIDGAMLSGIREAAQIATKLGRHRPDDLANFFPVAMSNKTKTCTSCEGKNSKHRSRKIKEQRKCSKVRLPHKRPRNGGDSRNKQNLSRKDEYRVESEFLSDTDLQCPYCGRQFDTGQRLGGHKRHCQNKYGCGKKFKKTREPNQRMPRGRQLYNANGDRLCKRGCGKVPHKGGCRPLTGDDVVPAFDENEQRVCHLGCFGPVHSGDPLKCCPEYLQRLAMISKRCAPKKYKRRKKDTPPESASETSSDKDDDDTTEELEAGEVEEHPVQDETLSAEELTEEEEETESENNDANEKGQQFIEKDDLEDEETAEEDEEEADNEEDADDNDEKLNEEKEQGNADREEELEEDADADEETDEENLKEKQKGPQKGYILHI